jgi:hypothetical protein
VVEKDLAALVEKPVDESTLDIREDDVLIEMNGIPLSLTVQLFQYVFDPPLPKRYLNNKRKMRYLNKNLNTFLDGIYLNKSHHPFTPLVAANLLVEV